MNTLLILTVGQTDVKLLEAGGPRELSKAKCGALHDEIARREGDWSLEPTPPTKIGPPTKIVPPADALPAGRFSLCTPKLDAVLAYARDQGIGLPTSVLLLETRRAPNSRYGPSEPHFAAELVAKRLRELGVGDITKTAYLREAEDLEGDDGAGAVIAPFVVERLDQAIRLALAEMPSKPDSQALVAATGGLPVVSPLVEEIALLHARYYSSSVELLEAPDGADIAVSRRRSPEPAALFQARRFALELIDKGNLLGAWGAVQHLHEQAGEQRWLQVAEWLNSFAASTSLADDCDIAILKHRLTSVRVALRVEFALRAGDIPRAVHGTVAFFEAALWDHLNPIIVRQRDKLDKNGILCHKLYLLNLTPPDELVGNGYNQPFRLSERDRQGNWYQIFDHRGPAAKMLGHHFGVALGNLADQIESVRSLRNDVAHSEPTPAQMDAAKGLMTKEKLWSDSGEFISQPLVASVLRELGVHGPERLMHDLLAIIHARLLGDPDPAPTGDGSA